MGLSGQRAGAAAPQAPLRRCGSGEWQGLSPDPARGTDKAPRGTSLRYALRRLGFFVLTLWVALTLNFLLPRLMPGNPALAMLTKFRNVSATPQTLHALEILFGVNSQQSLLSQYGSYLQHILTGNLGTSLSEYPIPVTTVIGSAIWWTLGLVGVATILAFILGTGLGIVSAWRRGSKLDSIVPPVFVITSAIPYFWVAMVLVLVFGLTLHWFPSQGGYYVTTDTPGFNLTFFQDVLNHAFLPAVALLITTIGTGILIEYVFNYPGIGYMLLQAVSGEDYPLMQALFLLITVAVLFAILVADIATALLDPRTREAK